MNVYSNFQFTSWSVGERAGNSGDGQAIDAEGNFFYSPKKFVAAIGVKDLVVVETADALLICPRERAQDVGKIVKKLEESKLEKLL